MGLFDEALSNWGDTGPDASKDPWGWALWNTARQGGRPQTTPFDLDSLYLNRDLLESNGLWDTAWDSYTPAYTSNNPNRDAREASGPTPDLSSLANIGIADLHGPDKLRFKSLWTGDGNLVGTPKTWWDSSSKLMRPKDWVTFAAVLAAPFGLNALYGGGAGLAGAAGATGAEAGIGTLGTIAQGSPTVANLGYMGLESLGLTAGELGALGAMSAGTGATSYPVGATLGSASGGLTSAEALAGFQTAGETAGLAAGSAASGGNYPTFASLAESSYAVPNLGGAGGAGGATGFGVRDGINLLSGLYGMSLANKAQDRADPFGPYRAQYAEQLSALMANPSSITERPGWLAGIESIQRIMASKGYAGAGNEKAALGRYAGEFFNQETNRLGQLAGAGIAPGSTAFSAADLKGRSLASIGYGLAPLFTGGWGG